MVETPEIAIPIARAMSRQEAGRAYPIKLAHWQAAHEMAFGVKPPPEPEIEDESETIAIENGTEPDRCICEPAVKALPKKSRKWSIITWLQRLFGISAATTFSISSTSDISAIKAYLDLVTGFVTSYGALVFVVACAAVFTALEAVKWFMAEDFEDGRYTPSGGDQ